MTFIKVKCGTIYHESVGGGVALLYASRELDKLPTENFDQRIGVQIVQNALKVRT